MRYDKGTFITVPTSSIMGIGVGPQALYMWLCKHANNDGDCFPSRSTLANCMGCSERSVDGYLEELIAVGLVIKEARYLNNKQTSNSYYLPLGGAKSARGVANPATLASQNLRTELNPVLTQSINLVADAKKLIIQKDTSDSDKPVRTSGGKKTTPAMLDVFEVFDDNPDRKTWRLREVERVAAQTLSETYSIEELSKLYKLVKKNRNDPYCPAIDRPSQMLTKIPSMNRFLKSL